jgi:(p)ppGpp synthase/HD superfamily hydrolase
VQKGTWRADRRHGVFYCTVKGDNKTYRQTWIRDILISQHETQYMSINALQTTKVNLQCDAIKKFAPLRQTMCLGCSASPADVAIVACGHVCVCVNCVAMCTQCPICRVPIGQTLKLFIS